MDARLQEISNQLSGKATEAPIADLIVEKGVESEGGDEVIVDTGDTATDVVDSDGAVDNNADAVEGEIKTISELAKAIEVEPIRFPVK